MKQQQTAGEKEASVHISVVNRSNNSWDYRQIRSGCTSLTAAEIWNLSELHWGKINYPHICCIHKDDKSLFYNATLFCRFYFTSALVCITYLFHFQCIAFILKQAETTRKCFNQQSSKISLTLAAVCLLSGWLMFVFYRLQETCRGWSSCYHAVSCK